jgi:hypothetical protein
MESADAMIDEAAALPADPRPVVLKRGIRYSHAAMIDMLISEPWIRQNELARRFDRSPSWISTIMASDAFQAAFAERSGEIVDPMLKLKIEEQFKGVVARSLEIIRDKLNGPSEAIPDQLALRSLELASRAAGYGMRTEVPVQVNITNQIENHAGDLVKLLRREKAKVTDPIIDVIPEEIPNG